MNIQTTFERPELVVGKITAFVLASGASASTTANVSYNILTRLPEGTQVFEYQQQKPEIRLWPEDMEIDVEKLLNKSVVGFKIGNRIAWHFYEPPRIGGCVEPPQPGTGPAPIIPGTVSTGTTPGTSGPSGGEPTPTPAPGGVD